ncbi:MAG: Ycf51 family protein [Cyanosarcina radialis HA8281-LM2]|jgi:hypothetical protein|nr:Ycf51 family protein [Cyanosarcina radialis HA8281-LM2]
MLTTADFLIATKWAGILAIVAAAVAVLGFVFQWGQRFRFVGVAGFMVVLTVGLFALSLTPLTRVEIPGAIRYSLVYDNGATQVVIAVPPEVNESQVAATLRQAAGDRFSYGRLGGKEKQLTIRARTIIHPQAGVSEPVYLGEVKRSLAQRDDANMAIEVYPEYMAKLPKAKSPV